MIKTTFLSLFILTQFAVFAITGDSTRTEYKTILPEEQHAIVLQASMEIVAANHYNKFKLDDQFSSQAFDNYLKHLDPGKVYFLQSDIQNFEKHRYGIDEMIGSGNVFPAFEMYNVLMKRIKDRINYSLDLIKNDFDFTLTDSFRFDREKSPWCADTAEQNKLWSQPIKCIFWCECYDY